VTDELEARLKDWHDAAVALASTGRDDAGYPELVELVREAAFRYESAATVVAAAEFLGLRARRGDRA